MIKITPLSSLVQHNEYTISHYISGLSKDAVLLFNRRSSSVTARFLPGAGETLEVIPDNEQKMIIEELRKGEISFSHCYSDDTNLVYNLMKNLRTTEQLNETLRNKMHWGVPETVLQVLKNM